MVLQFKKLCVNLALHPIAQSTLALTTTVPLLTSPSPSTRTISHSINAYPSIHPSIHPHITRTCAVPVHLVRTPKKSHVTRALGQLGFQGLGSVGLVASDLTNRLFNYLFICLNVK